MFNQEKMPQYYDRLMSAMHFCCVTSAYHHVRQSNRSFYVTLKIKGQSNDDALLANYLCEKKGKF